MRKIALTVLLNRDDSTLSPHFGMAKWLAVWDDDAKQSQFVGNVDLNGRALVELLQTLGCTDVICLGMGEGAFRLLQLARIQAWQGVEGLAIPQLVEKLKAGELTLILAGHSHAGHEHGHRHQHHHQASVQIDCAGPGTCCGSQQRNRYGQSGGGHREGRCCDSK